MEKNRVDWYVECMRKLECEFQGWKVFLQLNRVDRLPGGADSLGELLLR
jgi:hypothetical protein